MGIMETLRIGVIGSHGVGKTTLVNEISEQLKLKPITEVARNYDVNSKDKETLLKVQNLILNHQMLEESTLCNKGFISDRTTIDNLAYFILNTESTRAELGKYLEIAISNIDNYSHIFYIPIEFPLISDGFRNSNMCFQMKIDDKIIEILNCFNIKYHTVSGGLEQRVQTIIKSVKQ